MLAARFRIVAIAISLSIATPTPGADEAAPVAKPDVRVGETWRYRATVYPTNVPRVYNFRVRVALVGPDDILTVDGSDRDSIWSSEWNALSQGGPGVVYDKPRRLLSFPLKVGASHQAAYEVAARRGSGARSRYESTVKVVGWEDVVVPAGKFRALKVEASGTYQRLDSRGGGWTLQEIWYVPEVKRWVKWTYAEGPGAPTSHHQKNVDELLDYKVEQ